MQREVELREIPPHKLKLAPASRDFLMTLERTPDLLVVGNGPGTKPQIPPGQLHIRFNSPPSSPLTPQEIRISNRKFPGKDSPTTPFRVQSKALSSSEISDLQRELSDSANNLTNHLGCLPSTGLATVLTLHFRGKRIKCVRMPLRPSYLRTTKLSERKPLASAYHNWIGERRIGLSLLRKSATSFDWPELHLAPPPKATTPPRTRNIIPRLNEWFTDAANEPQNANTQVLAELAQFPAEHWRHNAMDNEIKEVEKFLFLARSQQETPNWWLYSNALSPILDKLILKLMLTQQHLLVGPEED